MGLQGVQNGYRVVGVGPGIHHDGVIDTVGGLNGVHDGPLMVGLKAVRGGAVGGGEVLQMGAQALVVFRAVNAWLPLAPADLGWGR